jgi:hypothetical protein
MELLRFPGARERVTMKDNCQSSQHGINRASASSSKARIYSARTSRAFSRVVAVRCLGLPFRFPGADPGGGG